MNHEQGLASKNLIVKKATELFREKGYHAATMRDIAKATGMSPANLYYHFPSKEAILQSALSPGSRLPLFESIAAGPEPVEERLRSVIRQFVTSIVELQDVFWIFLHDMRSLSPEARDPRRRGLKSRQKIVERLIAEGVETGVFTVEDPAFIVMNLMRMLDSIALWYRSDGPRGPEEIADALTNFLFKGLCTRDRVDSRRPIE